MAKLTNHSRGLRGISLKDGSTVWLEPGQSADIKKDDVAGALPDLGKEPTEADDSDGAEMEALKVHVAALTKQVEELEADKAELAKVGAASAKEAETLKGQVADLTKQIETLKKPAGK